MPSARAISFTSFATMVNSSGAVAIPKGKAVNWYDLSPTLSEDTSETVGVLVYESMHL